jgi:hypothetical protein
MEAFESTGNRGSESDMLPELAFPASDLASASDSRQQIPSIRRQEHHTGTYSHWPHPETLKAAFPYNLNYVIGHPLHLTAPERHPLCRREVAGQGQGNQLAARARGPVLASRARVLAGSGHPRPYIGTARHRAAAMTR